MQFTMAEIDDFIHDVLDKEELIYHYDEKKRSFRLQMGMSGNKINGLTTMIYLVPASNNHDRCMKIHGVSTIGIGADESCMSQVGEYLHRANFGLLMGKFELDYNDGEVRFSICYSTEDTFPGYELIRDLVHLPTAMFRRYGDGLLSVIFGIATPEAAIMKIEGDGSGVFGASNDSDDSDEDSDEDSEADSDADED